jgi:type II secretory pathway pseudopilin PulG
MTLIEVVVGLAILGTLVAGVAIARGRALRQYAQADRQLRATRAADQMLARWFDSSPSSIPLRGEGLLVDPPGCLWRTRPVSDGVSHQLGAVIVRFEISDFESRIPLVSLDFLAPRSLTTTTPTTRSP